MIKLKNGGYIDLRINDTFLNLDVLYFSKIPNSSFPDIEILDIDNYSEFEDILKDNNVAFPTSRKTDQYNYDFSVYKLTDEMWNKQ